MQAVIETANLTCRYRRVEAVAGLTFTVQPGTIFALLGPNGAGKTTTIRALMNILRPASGEARVLGIDSRRLGRRDFEAIGYVSENQKLPRWMTVAELLAFCRPLYPSWDDGFCRELVEEFQLPLGVKISRLSRGMRVKAALVSALAYRPRLLVLDEPFSGLDPVVRDDLVHGVLELAGQEQWTVLISSHDLDEVERLVDWVGFLDAGRLVLSESFADLHARFRRIDVTTEADLKVGATTEAPATTEADLKVGATGEAPATTEADQSARGLGESPVAPGFSPAPPASSRFPATWLGVESAGRVVRFVDTRYVAGQTERLVRELFPTAHVETQPMTLREIFVALVRDRRSRGRTEVPR